MLALSSIRTAKFSNAVDWASAAASVSVADDVATASTVAIWAVTILLPNAASESSDKGSYSDRLSPSVRDKPSADTTSTSASATVFSPSELAFCIT